MEERRARREHFNLSCSHQSIPRARPPAGPRAVLQESSVRHLAIGRCLGDTANVPVLCLVPGRPRISRTRPAAILPSLFGMTAPSKFPGDESKVLSFSRRPTAAPISSRPSEGPLREKKHHRPSIVLCFVSGFSVSCSSALLLISHARGSPHRIAKRFKVEIQHREAFQNLSPCVAFNRQEGMTLPLSPPINNNHPIIFNL